MTLRSLKRTAKLVLAASLAIAPSRALPTPVPAPPEESTDLAALNLEQLMALKVATVYGASKHEQNVRDAPASVTIITDDEIRKHGYRTLADALRSVRGIYVNYDRNYSFIGARGFNPANDGNCRILLLLDGHRLTENVYESSYIGTDFILDVDLIDHIEVIRGPGSSLYGSNAFFAVVNVISKGPRDVRPRSATLEGGRFNSFKVGVTVARHEADGIEFLVSASGFGSSGPERLYFREFDAPETNNGIAVRADDDAARNVAAKVSYKALSLEAVYNWRKKGIPTASYETVFNDPRTETIDSLGFVELGYRHESAAALETVLHVSYNRYDYDGTYIYDVGDPGGPPVLVRNIDDVIGEWWGADVQFAKRVGRGHRLTAGAELRENTEQRLLNFDEEPRAVYSELDRESRTWAIFGQGEFALHPKFGLTVGVRHDRYEQFGGTTNPRIAAIYHATDDSQLKLLYGRAFRAPNLYESFAADPATKPNRSLRPEEIATAEIIYERRWDSGFAISTSAYRSRIVGLISQEPDPDDGLLVNRNLGRVLAQGVEVEVGRRGSNRIEGYVSWAVQRTEDRGTGQSLANSPRHLGKLGFSAPVVRDRLSVGLDAQYSSAVDTISGGRAGAYWLANATLLARRVGRGGDLSLSVYNLLDRDYAYPGGGQHVQVVIPQDGRSFRIKFTHRF